MTRMVLLGPPGAGKGTQGQMLSQRLGIPQIATGDILRNAVANGTDIGLKAKSYMDAGDLVPDEIMVEIIRERLQEPDAQQGYILDGFPRTVAQAEALDEMLEAIGQRLDRVVHVDVDNETLVERLSGRLICRDCGATYHVRFHPPAKDRVCDECGGELYQREDDQEETVRSRLEVFAERTQPLVDYYRQQGIYHKVDGDREPETVLGDILRLTEAG
ncbi:adenylate kinase [Thiohalorhabdus denitrificans]|uniref:Adenylate kinase n=2 Tax=Thiohalorhabdus denitrificans TaxID=381306 RepID=A0A0P9CPF2_9GAMM|nr:adenylate kinase [Thiohalorhabdus denitrificans]KPV40975.1 adenylate kinase [Thiohalorhabdus denitrificans]SCY42936.1 Adenylate kinase [Thiohalorhabdus denitrificans]